MLETSKVDAINYISKAIEKVADAKTLVFVSGGSSAKITAAALAKVDASKQKNIVVMLADERYVKYDSAESNGLLLKQLGVQNLCNQFIEILSQNTDSADILIKKFNNNLRQQISEVANVIAIFGVGTNNHIAGIFPESVAATSGEELAVYYKAEDFERITITPAVFQKINFGFVYAEGKSKQSAIQTLKQKYDIISHPSQLIKQCVKHEIFYNKEGL